MTIRYTHITRMVKHWHVLLKTRFLSHFYWRYQNIDRSKLRYLSSLPLLPKTSDKEEVHLFP